MNEVADRISQLDDVNAIRLLKTVTDVLRQRDESVLTTEPTDDIRTALADYANRENAVLPETVTDGDLARAGLVVLAEDEKQALTLESLIEGPPAENYTGVETILTAGAILVALQTRFKFIVKDGKTQFEIAKPSLGSKQLLDLAGKITAWLKTK